MNLLPIFIGQIKARACNWPMEVKGGMGGVSGREEEGKRGGEGEEEVKKMEQNGVPGRNCTQQGSHS